MEKTAEELQKIFRDDLEKKTAELRRGKMMEPYNMAHFTSLLRSRGIYFPQNPLDQLEWAKTNGLDKLARKMAREGHWLKSMKRKRAK